MEVISIPLSEVKALGGRLADPKTIAMLKDSLAAVGLMNPVVVMRHTRQEGPASVAFYPIVAGRHRVQAARELGWTHIDAIVVELDGPHAELWEIDENLVRADLTAAQRASAHARRKQIMVALGLVNSKPGPPKGVSEKSSLTSYATQAAHALGVNKRTIEIDVARGEGIDPEVLAAVQNSKLDTGATLDVLAATPKPEQPAKLAEIAARRAETERNRREAAVANRNADRSIGLTIAQEFAAWLSVRTAPSEIATIIAWLEGAKARDVIAALRREAA